MQAAIRVFQKDGRNRCCHFQVVNIVAGGVAGSVTATFVCPLDVLKTRLQVQRRVPGVKYKGISGGSLSLVSHHMDGSVLERGFFKK